MIPQNSSNLETNTVLKEDAARLASTFRRRRKMVISIFTFFFIFLALIIVTLFVYLLRDSTSEYESTTLNSAIQTFYIYSDGYNSNSGLDAFDRIVRNSRDPIKNPNQIFTLALQTAAENLKDITSGIKETEFPSKNRSPDSLSQASNQIAGGVEIMRVNPFVQKLSDHQWNEMMDRIISASVKLKDCLDGLDGSRAVIGVRAKVREVQVYIRSCEQFLRNYKGDISGSGGDDLLQDSWWREAGRVVLENVFTSCVCGFALLFFVFMFRALCTTR